MCTASIPNQTKMQSKKCANYKKEMNLQSRRKKVVKNIRN